MSGCQHSSALPLSSIDTSQGCLTFEWDFSSNRYIRLARVTELKECLHLFDSKATEPIDKARCALID